MISCQSIREVTFAIVLTCIALLLWQPDRAMLGKLYEEALERKKQQYGASDTRTMQAARDLGLFLSKHGAAEGARKVFAEVVRLDESTLGRPPRKRSRMWRRSPMYPPPHRPNPSGVARQAVPTSPWRRGPLPPWGNCVRPPGTRPALPRFTRRHCRNRSWRCARPPLDEKARLAILIGGVAQVLGQIAEPAEGIAALRRSLAIDRSVLGPRHPETGTTQANLAGVLLDVNAVNESVQLITEALSILEETLGEDHPRVAISAAILAHGLRAQGDFTRAEQNYRRAVAVDERCYGPKHPQTLDDVRTLAEYLRERGRIQEAAVLEKRLVSVPK